MLKSMPIRDIVDVNQASMERIRSAFHVDDAKATEIVRRRPYRNWADFRRKHPEFSGPALEALRQSGVIIGAIGLNRLKR